MDKNKEIFEALKLESNWRYRLQLGTEVAITHVGTGNTITGTVSGLTRRQIDVDTSADLKDYTFDRASGIGIHGVENEHDNISKEYVIRPKDVALS